jgi:hypothetical protein
MLKVSSIVRNVFILRTVKNSTNKKRGGGKNTKAENTIRIVTNVILKILSSRYLSLATWGVDLQLGHPDTRYHELPSVPAERNSA